MAGNFLQQLYNTVDGIVLGNFVGETALSAIGSCSSLALVFVCLALGFSTGAGIMIAQFYGAQQISDMRKASSTCIILFLGMGLSFTLVGIIFTPWLMRVMLGIPEGKILDMAILYFRIYSAGLLFQFIYNIFAAILRSLGNSRATLYFLLASTVINIVLDLLFVAVFEWGVVGAAIATIFAQLVSAVLSVVYAFKKYPVLRFEKGEFVFDRKKCGLALRFGIPMTLVQTCVSVGALVVQRLVNTFGEVTMAAFTAGGRIEMYCGIPFSSFSAGLSTYVGQNIGAGKMDRVKKGHLATLFMSTGVSIVISLLAYFFAGPLSGLFGVEGPALVQAEEYVSYMAFFFILFSFYGTFTATLQGSGDVFFACLCTLTSFAVRCSTAYFAVYVLGFGYACCWSTIPIGWACCTPIAVFRYLSGRWKNKAIVSAPAEDAPENVEA